MHMKVVNFFKYINFCMEKWGLPISTRDIFPEWLVQILVSFTTYLVNIAKQSEKVVGQKIYQFIVGIARPRLSVCFEFD